MSYRNPEGKISNVRPATGPRGKQGTAYYFKGKSNSYIQLPNKGNLDAKFSITIIAWVFPMGKRGPLVNYMSNGWGVHFWVTGRNQFFARFVKRNKRFSPALSSNTLHLYRWNYLAATYNFRTGLASLWKNGRRVAKRYIGKFTIRTQDNIRIGARVGDRRYFRGKIACVQIYKKALCSSALLAAKHRCFKTGKNINDFL